MIEKVWKEGPAIVRCGESVLVGEILGAEASEVFNFRFDGTNSTVALWKEDWTPEYPKTVLPTVPGSVIIDATILGRTGHTALLRNNGDWLTAILVAGSYVHRPWEITKFTVAKVVAADE